MKSARGATSRVYINPTKGLVEKHVQQFQQYKIYERELFWIRKLNAKGYPWCPKLLSVNLDRKILRLEYAGTPINRQNAPVDWKNQLEQILSDLSKEGIKHNDIKLGELLVKNGQLSLVDYGWASMGNDWSCGGKFSGVAKPCHVFHDHTAIARISHHLQPPPPKPPVQPKPTAKATPKPTAKATPKPTPKPIGKSKRNHPQERFVLSK